jgi:hypothetical protein
MSVVKVTKVTKSTDASMQLEAFVSSLGVQTKTDLYLCNSQAYLNADIIMPVLSVTPAWFLKNAETPLHYIKIKGKSGTSGTSNLYINKYGMTKLLAQSKEAVAFKLQDYLYELLYRVETQGSVSREDVVSRQALVKLSGELDMYQAAASKSTLEAIELKESIETLRYDYSSSEMECERLRKEVSDLKGEIHTLETDVANYKNIANKLARYVRVKSKKPPSDAYDDSLEIDEIDDEVLDEITELTIVSDAVKAKNQLKKPIKRTVKQPIEEETKNKQAPTKTYMLLQSAEGSFADYKWSLSETPCTEEFKAASKDYALGDVSDPPAKMIWYADLNISEEKRKVISLFLSLKESYPESVIAQLI